MQQDAQPNIDDNVRRTVGYAALRQIHRLLAAWEREERRDRRIAFVLAGVLILTVLAAAAIYYGSLQLVIID
jgi:hypothetical protein